MYKKIIKRTFDFLSSFALIILVAPLYLVIAILVKINLGGSVIFRQERPGKNEKIFTMYKFKTMSDEKDKDGFLLPDDKRLMRFGKRLRATSLDELPELFNILKGDMSFVGPRPLLVQYLSRYSEEQARRHEVKPGLTGLAQVNGRNNIEWADKFKLDVWYVDHVSLWLDLKILLKTIRIVFKRTGINAKGEATMKEFMGDTTGD